MRRFGVSVVLGTSVLAVGCQEGDRTPLGVTLDDGQILIGGITTDQLELSGALGAVSVPLSDVGMVLPVEGRTLGDSNGHVTVWLRNGSELKGAWEEPELAMAIEVGGADVEVDVPTERMQALQLQASEAWPEDGLYRVRTTWGDDFLVDPDATRLTIENDMGVFSPFLSECRSVGPLGPADGEWRIELVTGTVLVGPLQDAEVTFALPMGPDEVVVPLDAMVSLERGAWSVVTEQKATRGRRDAAGAVAGEAMPASMPAPAPVTASPALSAEGGWFRNDKLEDAKY